MRGGAKGAWERWKERKIVPRERSVKWTGGGFAQPQILFTSLSFGPATSSLPHSCRRNYSNSVLVIKNSSFTFCPLPPWLLLLLAWDARSSPAALISLSLGENGSFRCYKRKCEEWLGGACETFSAWLGSVNARERVLNTPYDTHTWVFGETEIKV